ncbi:hypothetical protein H6F86_21820 [Phormidium sp. FACHB-592]|nr:hypothetical protein [Phormidium sp. FACHB-592]
MYPIKHTYTDYCHMTLEEFESQTREELEQALNQLQAATLLIAELSAQVSQAGNTVQALSRRVETFVSQQKGQ